MLLIALYYLTVSFFAAMSLLSKLYPWSQYNKGDESEKKWIRIKLTYILDQ